MTLHEVDLLSVRHRQQQEREDRRAALGAWILADVHRNSESRSEPFGLEEVTAWLGYGKQYIRYEQAPQEAAPAPDVQQIKSQVEMLNTLYGGVDQRNGQR